MSDVNIWGTTETGGGGTTFPVTVPQGGTGGTSEAEARDNLSVYSKAESDGIAALRVVKTASTGSAALPSGTTVQRDDVPAEGYLRYNSTAQKFEGYQAGEWIDFTASGSPDNYLAKTGDYATPSAGTTVTLGAVNAVDAGNAGYIDMVSGTVSQKLRSGKTGLGVALPLDIEVGGTLVARATSDGNLALAGTVVQGSAFGFRNKLINGNMAVNQRGSGAGVSHLSYTCDRWLIISSASTYNWSRTVGDAPAESGPGALLLAQASGAVPYWIAQRIEDVRTLSNKMVTVSFWAKADLPITTNSVGMQQNFGSGGSAFVNVNIINSLSLTTSWQYFTGTATLPSVTSKTIGVNNYLELFFGVHGTSGGIGIYLGAVQLEEGSIATPFEQRPYGLELSLCQRYYERASGASGTVYPNDTVASTRVYNPSPASAVLSAGISYKAQKRGIPTVSYRYDVNGGAAISGEITLNTPDGFLMILILSSGNFIDINDWQASAEL